MIERISPGALERLVMGGINDQATCVVKFYSNGCHLCHSLKEIYQSVSDEYDDDENIYFFAFNIADYPDLDNLLVINGTPSISLMTTGPNRKIVTLEDPENPNKDTWFTFGQIKSFVDKERIPPVEKPTKEERDINESVNTSGPLTSQDSPLEEAIK